MIATTVKARWNFSTRIVLTLLVLTGCSQQTAEYRINSLAQHRAAVEIGEPLDDVSSGVEQLLKHYFGSVDQPQIYPTAATADLAKVVNMADVQRCAGPVRRVAQGEEKIEFGLYRKHCAVCHGIDGDGVGAAAATLAPYPRDFRRGTFKFGTQGQGKPPSHNDLVRTLIAGIPGTAMPAMEALRNSKFYRDDADTLASYIEFLAIRGEVERRIWLEVIPQLDSTERAAFVKMTRLSDDELAIESLSQESKSLLALCDEQFAIVARRWIDVHSEPKNLIAIETENSLSFDWPKDLKTENRPLLIASAQRGKKLFSSDITACVQCHGVDGNGQGSIRDFDEWTKDWTVRIGIDPNVREQWLPLKKLGLLKPVVDVPRNFHFGVFRGGDDPRLIFDRIANGIDGTPMPAVVRAGQSPLGLSDDQIWDLVNYCQSLAFESQLDESVLTEGEISQPNSHTTDSSALFTEASK